tara:strand:+ start:73459 stop:74859 length:1401 start_codon:yes stop_codon:yes gene_type:complete
MLDMICIVIKGKTRKKWNCTAIPLWYWKIQTSEVKMRFFKAHKLAQSRLSAQRHSSTVIMPLVSLVAAIILSACHTPVNNISGQLAVSKASINSSLSKNIVLKHKGKGFYAIPKMIVTKKGTALIVLQDRNGGDWGATIDPLIIRSEDHGDTWSTPASIGAALDENGRFHVKPTSIVEDKVNGNILVFLARSPIKDAKGEVIDERWFYTHLEESWALGRGFFMLSSKDDGKTWSEPVNITSQLKRKAHWQEWSPVHTGIQIQRGQYAGRLVLPARAYTPKKGDDKLNWAYQSNGLIYSDDGGNTWHTSERSGDYFGEASIAELSDGAIYMNQRVANGPKESRRHYAISRDGGATFSERGMHSDLFDVKNHAGIERVADPSGKEYLMFSNVPGPKKNSNRKGLTITLSDDDAKSWGKPKMLEPSHASYSDLGMTQDGAFLLVYETGTKRARKDIAVAKFTWSWLLNE